MALENMLEEPQGWETPACYMCPFKPDVEIKSKLSSRGLSPKPKSSKTELQASQDIAILELRWPGDSQHEHESGRFARIESQQKKHSVSAIRLNLKTAGFSSIFLALFASKPTFSCVMPSNCSELFVRMLL